MKTFEMPQIDVIKLEVEDIITTSVEIPTQENELPFN